MATRSKIEWTGTTWNPVAGCTKVSPGCAHCYAEPMACRQAGMARKHPEQSGRWTHCLKVINARGHCSNTIDPVPEALNDPLQWKQPRIIFVNSMSGLFHEDLSVDFIRQVFDVINRCSRHTFQVLTKRSERLRDLSGPLPWAPDIWMGVSVENLDYMWRIDDLRRTGATVKFLSLEPLLGPLPNLTLDRIDWVIVGGESGPGARPLKADWVLDIRDQCAVAEIPFFFKQWGGVSKKAAGRLLEGRTWDEMPRHAICTESRE